MERDVEEVRAEAPRRVGAGGIDEEVEHDALAAHAAGASGMVPSASTASDVNSRSGAAGRHEG